MARLSVDLRTIIHLITHAIRIFLVLNENSAYFIGHTHYQKPSHICQQLPYVNLPGQDSNPQLHM